MMFIWVYILYLTVTTVKTQRQGCIYNNRHDQTVCLKEVVCRDYVDLSWNSFVMQHDHFCNDKINIQGYSVHLVKLVYRTESEELIRSIEYSKVPRLQHGIYEDYIYKCIRFLDLSLNFYQQTPNLARMQNLKTLSISRNSLSIAKLSNAENLLSLIDLDLSNNIIDNIIVKEGEYHYASLKTLNLSNNYLVKIPDSVFEPFHDLELLDLSYNYINELEPMTFEGVKKLNSLQLSNNRISDINSSLFRFSQLRHLNLSHNEIKTLVTRDFDKLVTLITLDLSSNSIFEIENTVFQNQAQLSFLNFYNNSIADIPEESFSNLTLLESIDLSYNKVKSLQKGLFKNKNIHQISLKNNLLQGSLSRGMFEGLSSVENEMDLGGQNISIIENYAFTGLDKITTLKINNNQLQQLFPNCFHSLNKLTDLDLSNNFLVDINFDKKDLSGLLWLSLESNYLVSVKRQEFNGLVSLTFLDLSNNKILNLVSDAFNTLKELTVLEMSNNPINGTLESNTFKGLQSLPHLDMSHTSLSTIENNTFNSMTALKVLNISNGNITEIQFNTFCYTGNVEVIDLSFNKLSTFNVNTSELLNLQQIFLSYNSITYITANMFQGLKKLNKIHIMHNSIVDVHEDAFKDLGELNLLDLIDNQDLVFNISLIKNNLKLDTLRLSKTKGNITFVDIQNSCLRIIDISAMGISNISLLYLQMLRQLYELNLRSNYISEILVGAFSNASELVHLDLSNNKISFIQPGVFKNNVQLKLLNMSRNFLDTISYGVFRGLNHLLILDMSYNHIHELKSERLYELNSLSHLIVDYNKISYLNRSDFSLNQLKLSIGGNPLPCDILQYIILNAHESLEITAIALDETKENIDGVTCNHLKNQTYLNKFNQDRNTEDASLLTSIRELLLNILNKKSNTSNMPEYFEKVSKNIEKYSDRNEAMLTELINVTINKNMDNNKRNSEILKTLMTTVANGNNNTNMLLKLMLNLQNFQSVVKLNATNSSSIEQNNTNNILISHINKIEESLENKSTSDNALFKEIENKIALMYNTQAVVSPVTSEKTKIDNDRLLSSINNYESKFTLIETCVILILILLLSMVSYKIYKSFFFIRNRLSISTRELPGAMENSAL